MAHVSYWISRFYLIGVAKKDRKLCLWKKITNRTLVTIKALIDSDYKPQTKPDLKKLFQRAAVFVQAWMCKALPLQWRHNYRDGVSNRQPHDCLLNHLFRGRSKKISKPVTRKMLSIDDIIIPNPVIHYMHRYTGSSLVCSKVTRLVVAYILSKPVLANHR